MQYKNGNGYFILNCAFKKLHFVRLRDYKSRLWMLSFNSATVLYL